MPETCRDRWLMVRWAAAQVVCVVGVCVCVCVCLRMGGWCLRVSACGWVEGGWWLCFRGVQAGPVLPPPAQPQSSQACGGCGCCRCHCIHASPHPASRRHSKQAAAAAAPAAARRRLGEDRKRGRWEEDETERLRQAVHDYLAAKVAAEGQAGGEGEVTLSMADITGGRGGGRGWQGGQAGRAQGAWPPVVLVPAAWPPVILVPATRFPANLAPPPGLAAGSVPAWHCPCFSHAPTHPPAACTSAASPLRRRGG